MPYCRMSRGGCRPAQTVSSQQWTGRRRQLSSLSAMGHRQQQTRSLEVKMCLGQRTSRPERAPVLWLLQTQQTAAARNLSSGLRAGLASCRCSASRCRTGLSACGRYTSPALSSRSIAVHVKHHGSARQGLCEGAVLPTCIALTIWLNWSRGLSEHAPAGLGDGDLHGDAAAVGVPVPQRAVARLLPVHRGRHGAARVGAPPHLGCGET